LETTFTATQLLCDIGGGVSAQAEVFNGKIPGPTLRLKVGDRVAIRLINDLPYPIGMHWHGVELENYSDGTEIVQNGVPGAQFKH
jgi:FtsP/CotA-like multicopper oxidase with cupredoxin domain